MPNDIHWVRNSAEYRASLIQTYRFAGEVLSAMAADLEPGTWAVALDADETVIDNSQYQKERAAIDEGYSSDSWAEWVSRRRAPALPGALEFLAQIRQLGGKITIVTNRKQAHCPDTEANFRAHQIPFDVILCKPPGAERKEARWQQIENGTAAEGLPPLDIVMWLGDNIGDFPEQQQSLRLGPESAYERFGIDFFVLPNPMYGSWEDNPTN
ncbi:MAG: HAD family acid phosphatase [Acidobacteriota bacterium]